MGCCSTELKSPYNTCNLTLRNVATEILKIFPMENNKILVCSSTTYQILNLSEENTPESVEFEKEIYTAAVVYRKDGLKLIQGTTEGRIYIEDIETDDLLTIIGHKSTVTCLLVLRNKKLCSASADGQVIIWNIKNGKDLYNFYPHNQIIWSIIELNDGNLLSISGDNTGNIVSYGKEMKLEFTFKAINSKCIIQLFDGRVVYNSNLDIYIYKLGNIPDINIPEETIQKGQYEPDFVIKEAHLIGISVIIQLKNGDICSAGDDGFIKLWSLEFKFQMIIELDAHKTKVNDIVEFNNTMISCSNDRTIKVWVN